MKAALIVSSIVMFISAQALAAKAEMISVLSLETKFENYVYSFSANKSVDAYSVLFYGGNENSSIQSVIKNRTEDEAKQMVQDFKRFSITGTVQKQNEKITIPVFNIDKIQEECIQSQVEILNNFIKNSNNKFRDYMSYNNFSYIDFFLDTSPEGHKEISPSRKLPHTLSIQLLYNEANGCNVINADQLEKEFNALYIPKSEAIAAKNALTDLLHTNNYLNSTLSAKRVDTNTKVNSTILRRPAVIEPDVKDMNTSSNTTR